MDTLKVIDAYQNCKSLKKIAAEFNLSEVKVRRILITAGLWRSKTSDAIKELLDQNLTVAEVAEKLCMTEKNVQAYMPYRKGTYDTENISDSAIRSRLYRFRCQTAAANQINHAPAEGTRYQIIRRNQAQTVHLHLALDIDGMSETESQILSNYAKVSSGITRDVLVPSTLTLHALHYLIQRAFGWQNSHLHHFALPQNVFISITESSFQTWRELCGVLFRFPDMPIDDLYWDNDYDGSVSIKSWMQQKYRGPYRYGGFGELHSTSQESLRGFISHFPQHTIAVGSDSIDDVCMRTGLGDPSTLLERLTIGDLMLSNGAAYIDHLPDDLAIGSPITSSLKYYYDYGDSWEVNISVIEDSPEAENHPEVAALERPLCIAADGLDVLENIGGVPGFCKFLTDLNNNTSRIQSSAQEIARTYGWTGKNRKVSSIV